MEKTSIDTVEYIKLVKESPEKKKSYIFFAFTIIAVILLSVFAIRPTISTITRINKEIKEKNRLNVLLDNKITTLSKLDSQYLENKKQFNSLKLIYPADGNFSLLLSNLDSIVSRNGFILNSITFDDYDGDYYDIGTTTLSPQSLRVSVRGKQVNIVNLLKEFEALPMYPVVETLSFSSQEDDEGFCVFSIGLRIYDIDSDNFYK